MLLGVNITILFFVWLMLETTGLSLLPRHFKSTPGDFALHFHTKIPQELPHIADLKLIARRLARRHSLIRLSIFPIL